MARRELESATVVCPLCGRDMPRWQITLHHLTPKERGGKAEDRTPMCRPCHKQLHALFSNKHLARQYRTIESLREAPELHPFLRWIRKQNPDRNFKTVQSNAHPNRGRRR
jgi:5-methylcytosine-specific restriction enzyme A